MKDLLEYLVKNIVDEPEAVAVEEINNEGFVNLNLTVAQPDMGKVIGKGGRIIKAIRDLVRILAVKQNTRVNVTLAQQ
ncbi:KH domain-containing protein [Patescibacteria group bacterium]|nr:KH domain-containing protein [Patescibacteria group bacterium]